MKTNRTLLFVLFCIALAMRFYNYADFPLSHDELSAIFRSEFDSFSELIELGVKADTHPAAVQVFLYYWVKLVGVSTPWLLKLPFTLLGIASLFFVYKSTKLWFSTTTALIVLAFLVCSPFHIYYSQIIRPYIVGFAFYWAMNWMLSRYLKQVGKPSLNLVLFVIFALLTCSSHYLSMLSAVLSAVFALFLASKKQLKALFIANLSILILYIPQLHIFMKQLGVGGVFWLSKPEPDFFVDFLFYIHNFSWVAVVLVLIIIGLSFVFRNKKQSILSLAFAFILIALPYLISYFYSVYRIPILQYSLLFFAFPFLLIFLFGRFRNLTQKQNIILTSSFILIFTATTLFSRNYYHYYYQNLYQNLWDGSKMLKTEYPNKTSISLIKNHPRYSSYYSQPSEFVNLNKVDNPHEFFKIMNSSSNRDLLYLAGTHDLDPTYFQMAQHHFPYLIKKQDYFGGSSYLFSKTELPQNIPTTETILTDLKSGQAEVSSKLWKAPYLKSHQHSTLGNAFVVDSTMLKSITFNQAFSTSILEKNTILDIQADLSQLSNCEEVELIFLIRNSKETLLWSSKNINTIRTSDSDEFTSLFFSYFFPKELIKKYTADGKLEIYFLNPKSGQFKINTFKISTRQGNLVVYGVNDSY